MLIVFAAQHLTVLLLCLAATAGAGTLAIGKHEPLALRTAVGIALWAHACFFLAAAGLLRAEALLVLALAALAVRVPRPRTLLLLGGALLSLGLYFTKALYPPHAFDETLYHLSFMRAFAQQQGLVVVPTLRFPVFPVLHELSSVPPFLLLGDSGTHLVALVQCIVTAALLVTWAGEHHPRARWLAAAMFLGSPLIVELATILYVEMALILFVTAGFYALDRKRYALAGLFLGSACSVKYLGVYFAAVALLILLVRRATRTRAAAAFAGACTAAALPMTLWIFSQTRDIVFPYLRATIWTPAPPAPMTLLERATRIGTLVWDVTFARERTGLQPPVTPVLVLLIVLAIVGAMRETRYRVLLLLSSVYVIVYTFLPPDSRYLVPLLPLFSIAAAVELARRWPHATRIAAVIAIAPGLAYAGYRLARHGVPPATPAQERAWLEQRVPEYRGLQRAGGERLYACGGEQLRAYAEGKLLGDHTGVYAFARVLNGADTTAAIAERLRRIDVRYYLVAKRHCAKPTVDGGMDLVYEDRGAQLWRVR